MKTFLSAAALAAVLIGGGIMAAEAAGTSGDGRIHMAQMNSPGDGLDKRAASEGNARPNRMGMGRRMVRMRHHRMRHHRRHR